MIMRELCLLNKITISFIYYYFHDKNNFIGNFYLIEEGRIMGIFFMKAAFLAVWVAIVLFSLTGL